MQLEPWIVDAVAIAIVAILAAVLVLFGVVLRRVGGIARRLDALPNDARIAAALADSVRPLDASERLRVLDEQGRALRDDVARLPKPLVAGDLAPILDKIARLEVILGDVRIRVDEQRARTEYSADDEGGLPGRMRRSLAQRGYEMIHVLADPVEGSGSDELRIPVEARRAGMTFKGTVTVSDGRVTDVALNPATGAFP